MDGTVTLGILSAVSALLIFPLTILIIKRIKDGKGVIILSLLGAIMVFLMYFPLTLNY